MNEMRRQVTELRRSLPAAALPFAANLFEQFKVYEKHPKLRAKLKPLMAWQWERLKRAASSSAIQSRT